MTVDFKVNFPIELGEYKVMLVEKCDAGIPMILSLAFLGSRFTLQRDTWMLKKY